MNAEEFNKLSLLEAKDIVFIRGLLIEKKRLHRDLETRIYLFNNFYIQTYINTKTGQILNIQAIDTEDDWDEFMCWLDIEQMFHAKE